jgi:quercetin dioxygenase-like cupin family protein
MSARPKDHGQGHQESLSLYALRALSDHEVSAVESQIAECAECQRELNALRPVLDRFDSWPAVVLRPSTSLWERLAGRISAETGQAPAVAPTPPPDPEWEEAAPGIFCKILATDLETGRVSMLVRLVPGAEYPPHVHAGLEELHMLQGELLVNDQKLYAGDYLRSEPGTEDHRVWSETGCMGVLITSFKDVLR